MSFYYLSDNLFKMIIDKEIIPKATNNPISPFIR